MKLKKERADTGTAGLQRDLVSAENNSSQLAASRRQRRDRNNGRRGKYEENRAEKYIHFLCKKRG